MKDFHDAPSSLVMWLVISVACVVGFVVGVLVVSCVA